MTLAEIRDSLLQIPAKRTLSPKSAAPALLAFVALALIAYLSILALRPDPVSATLLQIQTSTPTPEPGTGSIAGMAWADRDGDGLLDAGELPLTGMIITVQNADTNATSSVTSGLDGKYQITGLTPALYHVTAVAPALYVLTTQESYDVPMTAGAMFVLYFGAWLRPTATPSPTPPPVLQVDGAENLACGGIYTGDTRIYNNNVSRYGCRSWWDESGKEAVYRLQLTASQPVTITLLNASADLDLFLLRDALPASCLAVGDNYLTYAAETGVYFLSVDGYRGAEGTYEFRVDCPAEEQATPTPTFTPSPTPTGTPTGTPAPTLTRSPTIPPKMLYLPLVLRANSGPVGIPVTFTVQDGLNGYAGTTDTTLDAGAPTVPQGEEKNLILVYSRDAEIATQKEPVLRFDLNVLPQGALVQQSILRLYVPATPLYDVRVRVYGLLRPWEEKTATWQLAAADQPWSLPGAADIGSDRTSWVSDAQRIVEGSRWYEFDVTPLVQEWARNMVGNNGMVLSALPGDSDASVEMLFVSREGDSGLRPQLVVSYRTSGSGMQP